MADTDLTKRAEAAMAGCMSSGQTLRQQLELGALYLQAKQVDEARENAELLLLHLLAISRAQLLMNWLEPFPEELLEKWGELLERKGTGEPLQYITGEAGFYGRTFQVTPAVLIPRPETELLVEAVLQLAQNNLSEEALTVVDIGTGSGAIAISLKLEQPKWQVIASDLSPAALTVAKQNAELHRIAEQMEWVQGDLLQPFCTSRDYLSYKGKKIDIVVSNPPYIPEGDMAGLQREVQQYEPHLALVGGEDGLDPYRHMLQSLQQLKELPRIIAFELGIYQPSIVADWLAKLAPWNEINIVTDYNGIDRHVIAIRTN